MIRAFLFLFLVSLAPHDALAQDIPQSETPSLYELGAGFGAAWFPHYPGSDQERLFALPFPYFVYRGHVLRSNREEGTRARFLRGRDYEVSLSAGGAFPVSSENNVAREGMPDLGWIVELGPKFRLNLAQFENRGLLRLGLAARAVVTSQVAWTTEHHGTVFELEFVFDRPRFIADVIDLRLEASSRWATEGYQSYLYEVPTQYVKAARPQYSASGGYLYSSAGVGFGYRTKSEDHRIGLFSTIDSLSGNPNVASPLVKTQVNTTVGIAYITVLHHSEAKAVVE
ncbi:MAG: MipA/OmpV family protein [Bdellovibrionota bacterium]